MGVTSPDPVRQTRSGLNSRASFWSGSRRNKPGGDNLRTTACFLPEHPRYFLSAAEEKVFKALKRTLTDPAFTVLYSVPWVTRKDLHAEVRDHEADYLIFHPQLGVLVIEVKGGCLKNDRGSFWRVLASGEMIPADNPVMQVRGNYYGLLDELQKNVALPKYLYGGYALIFPDVLTVQGGLGEKINRDSVWFAEDLLCLGQKITTMMQSRVGCGVRNPLGEAGVAAIVDYLLPFSVAEPKLSEDLKTKDKLIEKLTKRQETVLDILVNIPQALISGGAGTGKTYLAVEKARRLAKQGKKVLLTCFNRPLAEELERNHKYQGLTILNFHQLCWRQACQAGILWHGSRELPDPDGDQAHGMDARYFDEFLPKALAAATGMSDSRFDAVIIDEGQDFNPVWLQTLRGTLREPKQDVFYVFFDDNQNLWRKEAFAPTGMPLIPLRDNLRNSRQVFESFESLYDGLSMQPAGPDGGKVDFTRIDANRPESIAGALKILIRRLIEQEGLVPKNIAVLTGVSLRHSVLRDCADLPSELTCSSVMRFKGLERPVIVLIEMDAWFDESLRPLYGGMFSKLPEPEKMARSMLFVGMSRARTHLFVIGGRRIQQQLERRK